jgi:hypothetical protein
MMQKTIQNCTPDTKTFFNVKMGKVGEVGMKQQEIFSFYFLFNTEDTKKKLAVVAGGRNEETYSRRRTDKTASEQKATTA